MNENHTVQSDLKRAEALNILNAAKWHKENCEDTECNISLYLLGETYRTLTEHELNAEERSIFF